MVKRKKLLVIGLPIVFLLLIITFLASQMSFAPRDKILPGVYMQNIELSGMDYNQAIASIGKLEQQFQKPIQVKYKDQAWVLPMSQVGLKINCKKEVQRALDFGRKGTLRQQFLERRQAFRGAYLKPDISLDKNLLEKLIVTDAAVIILPPRDAGLIIHADNRVEVSPGRSGRLVDIDHLESKIIEALLKGISSPIELKLIDVPPIRSTEQVKVMGVNTLLGMFSTKFDPNKVNRAYNVSVAAAALDGLTVSPQEVISFNEVVGPRSTEAGYKNAPIIVNNEMVDGLGGGVCQVSTTLYNAVLLANLEVVERTNHSLPIPYVPIGRDATVVFDSIDFKFKNNTNYWLYIQSYVKGGTLIIKIFGNSEYKKDVVIRSWVEETYDPKTLVEDDYGIPLGDRVVRQRGAKGYMATGERIIMKDNIVIKVEKLPTSIYKARNQIISQGMAPIGTILKNPN
ncbi:VanW family protein [Desulforamulus reducens]|uniref:VanW family protein n=1 Tax=Desulforamulus reducens TaxID=59610 RepID=UPI00059ED250|nr:VanW family protein [Desulforamulus reducens]